MRHPGFWIGVLAIALAPVLGGQTLGNYVFRPNSSAVNRPIPFTIIDLGSGATGAGTIGAVAFHWSSGASCPNAMKVKFFRRTHSNFTMIAERGPFSVTSNHQTVALDPPVAVQPGDLLGLTRLTSCGGPSGLVPILSAGAYQFDGDITGTVSADTLEPDSLAYYALAAYGAESTESEIRTHILVAAGSATGLGGSHFKSDVFLGNPLSNAPVMGRLVYHPEMTSGTPSDASVPFTIPRNGTTIFPDFVGASLGLAGKGSVDVYVRIGGQIPVVSARIYDDAGAAGTKGFSFDALPESEAIGIARFESGTLFAPDDMGRFRMNIGIRTLDEPTELEFTIYSTDGLYRGSVARSYPANYYLQAAASVLLGMEILSGDMIVMTATSGSAFVYGSIADNTTNDPSLQMAVPR